MDFNGVSRDTFYLLKSFDKLSVEFHNREGLLFLFFEDFISKSSKRAGRRFLMNEKMSESLV